MGVSMIEGPRIRAGKWLVWATAICLLLAAFCAMAASGGAEGAGAVAAVFVVLASAFGSIWFWRDLFAKIEQRLIDIEIGVKPSERPPAR